MNKDLKNKLFKDKFPGIIYIDTSKRKCHAPETMSFKFNLSGIIGNLCCVQQSECPRTFAD